MIRNAEHNELKQLSNCACFNLRKTTRAVTQYYDQCMKSAGLRGTQFTILSVLFEAKCLTITHLAAFLMMDRTTLTRNLKPLEKQGFIQILPGADQRTRELRLTEKGFKNFKIARPLWEAAQSNMIEKLGAPALKKLLDMLDETVAVTR